MTSSGNAQKDSNVAQMLEELFVQSESSSEAWHEQAQTEELILPLDIDVVEEFMELGPFRIIVGFPAKT